MNLDTAIGGGGDPAGEGSAGLGEALGLEAAAGALLNPEELALPLAPTPLSLRANFSWTFVGNVVYAGFPFGVNYNRFRQNNAVPFAYEGIGPQHFLSGASQHSYN